MTYVVRHVYKIRKRSNNESERLILRSEENPKLEGNESKAGLEGLIPVAGIETSVSEWPNCPGETNSDVSEEVPSIIIVFV